jgi:hypothetical protein
VTDLYDKDAKIRRESEVIAAMQYRTSRWLGPLDIFWRKPWRSTSNPGWRSDIAVEVNLSNWLGWLLMAHDCYDPAVGCSCHPSYRFPDPNIPPPDRRRM